MRESNILTKARFSEGLVAQEPDALLALIGAFRSDPREDKIDVGLGVYRNTAGDTPVFSSVKEAERRLCDTQISKGYFGPRGNADFLSMLGPIVLGTAHADSDRIVGYQTPGGGGALRLGLELIAASGGSPTVWVSDPTWPNHHAILSALGLAARSHSFFDPQTQTVDFQLMLDDLQHAQPGDVWLLHGACHNPTGVGFDLDQWNQIIKLIVERGLIPFIDLAYQGLGKGLEEDAAGLRAVLDQCEEAIVSYSCDKNFGLYRERTGALWVQGADASAAARCNDAIAAIAQGTWSMPPDHGAAVVAEILGAPDLTADWREELAGMQARLTHIRQVLAGSHPALSNARDQTGLFMLLPLSLASVASLREDHSIYMAPNGRINISGLSDRNFDRFTAAIAPLLNR